jgi:hypothetical protein
MDFGNLFNVFSKRPSSPNKERKALTQSFRYRVFMRCRDAFGPAGDGFWAEIQTNLAYLHGQPRLSPGSQTQTDDALNFLTNCTDPHFLDFLEYIFHTQAYFHASGRAALVNDVNEFFRQDDLPYALTDFVWTKGVRNEYGREYETSTLTAYPMVIRKDSEILHQTAIAPVLQLLGEDSFTVANKEFLQALEDYRKGDFGDCLVKCASCSESVLKVLCKRKGWPHNENDNASPLLKTVITRSGLEPFFEQPLILVATLRNKLSTAHGAGTSPRIVSQGRAEYAINATAAGILLLTKETG